MKDLDEAIERLCELKGEQIGLNCLLISIFRALPMPTQKEALREFDIETEAARVVLLNSALAGEHVIRGFESFVQRVSARRSDQN